MTEVVSLATSERAGGVLWSGALSMSGLHLPSSLVIVIATAAAAVIRVRLEQWQLIDRQSSVCAGKCAF